MKSNFGPCGTQYVKAYKRNDGKYVPAHNRTTSSQPIDKKGKPKQRGVGMR